MQIDIFKMERMQSTWENVVDYNLSESGVHPLNLKELLTPAELESLTEVEPGDEVLFELPNYMQMWGLLRAFGARVKPFYLREALGWQPDLDEMKRLVTPKTKLIVLTNPNNPTGSAPHPAILKGIVDLAAGVGAWLLADDGYHGGVLSRGR